MLHEKLVISFLAPTTMNTVGALCHSRQQTVTQERLFVDHLQRFVIDHHYSSFFAATSIIAIPISRYACWCWCC